MAEKMHVIALTKFNDKLEGVTRNEGDIFTVSIERYEQIMAYRTDLIEVYEVDPLADPEATEEGEQVAEGENPEQPAEGAEPPADPEATEEGAEEKPAKPAAKKSQRKNASK